MEKKQPISFGLKEKKVKHVLEIVVMSKGLIQQVGTPEKIYHKPQNAFVADFIGESNIFNGIKRSKDIVRFAFAVNIMK